MKGEYVEERDHPNMFAKLHQTQNYPQPPLHHHHHHQTQLFQATRECQTSEEADSRSPSTTTATKKELITTANDGATIEVVRRPRGRPPGSKNKPKPPVVITRESEPSMSPYVLELPGGVDIVDSITRYCRKRNMGLCILSGSGTVANVTLRQPSTTPGATVTFHGRFDLLSLSATVLPTQMTSVIPATVANGFTISLAGPQGQVVGGNVVGSLMAAGTVYVIAASFNNPSYHRLPVEEEITNTGSGGNEGHQSPPAVSGGGDCRHPPSAAESCGMAMYSCHLPSDVIWAPTARPPPPY
ncbi:unnamed protein product [Ilex paraguariensis]|uniref:AT-hook motif nuclear-localized protein n=1 Tax=Ilex paraguariensis TaxID=185542 RepID=A0ABC8T2K2_9AQUA